MSSIEDNRFTRRTFMKAGGALVVMAAAPGAVLDTLTKASAAPFYAAPDQTSLAAWLTINADGTVLARSSHVELGHGITTGLAQIVAEELDVPFSSVGMLLGNTDTTPDQGGTFGSQTIKVAGTQWRQIAAEGRAALLKLASARLGTPAGQLTVKNGVVSNGSQTVSYAQLVQGQVLTAVAPLTYKGGQNGLIGTAKPKDPSQYSIVGQSLPRIDIPDKVTAKATYVVDVKLPNMMHARVIQPKGVGSTVVSVGDFSTPMPGAQVVRVGNLVAVAAEREWDAIRGAQALQVTWSDWNKLPTSANFYDTLRTLKTTDRVIINRGDAASAIAAAPTKLSATYTTPFENHGMIGPSCAVADVKADGSVTVHSGTQYPQGLQKDIAQMLGIPVTSVQVLRYEGSGEYGRLSANYDDAASEAVFLSQKLGRPVRVQWTRADEHRWEPHGPGTVHDLKAGLDASGNIVAWVHEAWMPPTNDSIELGAALAGKSTKTSGTGGWTGPDLYTFANLYEVGHGLPELGAEGSPYGFGLRTTFLRSPGQYQITFAQEAFIDEIAAAAKQDPLQFRLNHLSDPRAIAVLQADTPRTTSILINRPEVSPTGVGEPATNLIPSAISSAIFDATGVRIRALPLRPDRVKAALSK